PVVAAIVLDALWKLRTAAVRDLRDLAITALAVAAAVFGVAELAVLLLVGVASIAIRRTSGHRSSTTTNFSSVALAASIFGVLPATIPLWKIFFVFLQIGSVIYGSGYVLLVFLDSEVVDRGWISTEVLLDAISVGQFTPGPVFTTATFIGWHLAGFAGAAVATLGIFGPSFVFAALIDRVVSWSRRSRAFGAFLRGVSSGSIVLMAAVLVRLADEALVDEWAIATFVVSLSAILGVPQLRRLRNVRRA
ncbi:MAG: chromate transporter, partial [Ilumatobacteraceae bacterium]